MHPAQKDGRLEREGHFVGLKWDEGWWFIQVLGTSVEELKPWVLYDSNDNRDAIAGTTAGNEDEFRDENNRLQLEPDDDERGLVFQILTGVWPSRATITPKYGREYNLGLEQSMNPGDDEIWISGFDSPYNNPGSQSEIYYVNDMSTLKFEAYNPMSESTEVRVSFLLNKLHYATVTDVNMMKGMLQNQVKSSKHMMGLGATSKDQLSVPQWLESAFGEHIKETSTILSQGNVNNISGNVSMRENTNLAGAGRN